MSPRVALISLGSRPYFIAALVTSIVLLGKTCSAPPSSSSTGESTSDGGTGGSGGEGGATSSGGTGGDTSTGTGATGGTGGTGGSGGTGGETTTSSTSTSCTSVGQCDPKQCGTIDDCGTPLDCDHPKGSDPVTCASENANFDQNGPMTCGQDNLCHCQAEGDSPAAMALCEGPNAEQGVKDFCAKGGGCHTAFCGAAPVPKVPPNCVISSGGNPPVWCCTGAL